MPASNMEDMSVNNISHHRLLIQALIIPSVKLAVHL